MGTIRCARCGAAEDEASASFAEEGLICALCHSGEKRRDAEQMAAQQRQANAAAGAFSVGLGSGGAGMEVSLASSSTQERVVRAPATALHADLAGRGLKLARVEVRRSSASPLGTSAREGYRETWTLPSAPAVQASLTAENLGRKLVKLFKRELQTGDASFDAAVYISTDTPDATAAWLASADVRALVGGVVSAGGALRIEGVTVAGEVTRPMDDPYPPQDDTIARVVASLLG